MNRLPIDLSQLRKLSLKTVERKKRKKPKKIKKIDTKNAAPYYKLGTYFICRECCGKIPIRSTTLENSKLKLPKVLVCQECRKNANTDG